MEPLDPDGLIIEPLQPHHNVRKFRCGDNDIDVYLRAFSAKNTAYGFGKTYVGVFPDSNRVWAYYTVSAHAFDAEAMVTNDGCPAKISVILLGKLGVDKALQRKGVGQRLMVHAFGVSLKAALLVGIHGVVLNAKHEGLKPYYESFGFHSLMDDPLHMFIPMLSIVDGLKDE